MNLSCLECSWPISHRSPCQVGIPRKMRRIGAFDPAMLVFLSYRTWRFLAILAVSCLAAPVFGQWLPSKPDEDERTPLLRSLFNTADSSGSSTNSNQSPRFRLFNMAPGFLKEPIG